MAFLRSNSVYTHVVLLLAEHFFSYFMIDFPLLFLFPHDFFFRVQRSFFPLHGSNADHVSDRKKRSNIFFITSISLIHTRLLRWPNISAEWESEKYHYHRFVLAFGLLSGEGRCWALERCSKLDEIIWLWRTQWNRFRVDCEQEEELIFFLLHVLDYTSLVHWPYTKVIKSMFGAKRNVCSSQFSNVWKLLSKEEEKYLRESSVVNRSTSLATALHVN